ncbi:peptide/nickel transport system permease protein/oligopeptide transport system permease protein [Asanoa ferruginea]|uniref:Peptide/nickel transport system permease protein/oligopeptide transport system permease protein n=1 Tax=Asanoa ferruginea TaxID=53367 RepID=A0A3D9ZD15_9ACTN|nr:ABC transporter permease [Asanoa ferruginea]REF95221.1 peptide/nickel transport system permease protein/oligopeptide transport system permease protein [Asanoa ferruginea]GIF53478.1 ABC transporter permease [Asanoa ferruginea]
MSDLEMAATSELGVRPLADPGKPPDPAANARTRSLAGDAWYDLRRNWIFWVAAALVVLVILMAVAPGLFSSADPNACNTRRQFAGPSGGAFFGYDFQGCDVFSRTVHGARASVLVGVFAVLMTGVIGLVFGMLAGYFGGWLDALLSRVVDVVLGIPLLLAAIVLSKRLSADRQGSGIVTVVIVLGILGWTTAARVMRSSVLAARSQDYVAAARMLGAGPLRIMWRHILPNALAPFIVVLTIALGTFIATEATLSFLNIGLRPPAISWGIDISTAGKHVREAAMPLIAPSLFLTLTVLAFIMLGDAIRDAFDPKLR